MKNFKEIAKKCLAGELSGVFIFNTGEKFHSQYLKKSGSENYFYLHGLFIDKEGQVITKGVEEREIINFITNSMKEQIKIDIPEGKVPVIEQTENGVVITWKEKELTYNEIYNDLADKAQQISPNGCCTTCNSRQFNEKVEVLRKLTNIRNYFGKPASLTGYMIIQSGIVQVATNYHNSLVFAKKEHAEQAIKMLGDELKYLFEPW